MQNLHLDQSKGAFIGTKPANDSEISSLPLVRMIDLVLSLLNLNVLQRPHAGLLSRGRSQPCLNVSLVTVIAQVTSGKCSAWGYLNQARLFTHLSLGVDLPLSVARKNGRKTTYPLLGMANAWPVLICLPRGSFRIYHNSSTRSLRGICD